jgi:hypothetical protein
MIPKNLASQVDFSAGQVDATALRRDDAKLLRAALRQAVNARATPNGPAQTRMGRRLLVMGYPRVDDFSTSAGTRYVLCFQATRLDIRERETGEIVKQFTGLPWTAGTEETIRWAQFGKFILLAWQTEHWQVLDMQDADPTNWTVGDFAFAETLKGTIAQPYIRLQDVGATMEPAAYSGTGVAVVFSADVLEAGHVGVRFRYSGRELEIVTVVDAQNGTADIIEKLPTTYEVTCTSTTPFSVGDSVEFKTNRMRGVVSTISSPTVLRMIATDGEVAITFGADELVGPNGRTATSSVIPQGTPDPAIEWDEAVITDMRGWPESVSTDANRLIACRIPADPAAVMWSAVGIHDDFGIDATPDSGIYERVQGQVKVVEVLGGPDEFVMTDRGIYYIPISASSPLRPGSVEFRPIGALGAAPIRPAVATDGVVFVDAGLTGLWAIRQTGQTTQPYLLREIGENHRDLITGPVALAISAGRRGAPERFIYLVNEDGTVVAGRYNAADDYVGFFPWSGRLTARWVSANTTGVILTSRRIVGAATRYYGEELDEDTYSDAEVSPLNVLAGLAADKPGGQGDLWMFAGDTVRLRLGARDWGDRSVDALGNLVTLADDDLTADYVVGLPFTMTVEPFIPNVAEGDSRKQRQRLRRIARSTWVMERNTAFAVNDQGRPAHNERDDMTVEPPTRIEGHRFRHLGRSFDPRVTLTQTTVGRVTLMEFNCEVTI